MYIDFNQMKSEIDSYMREGKDGLERVRAEWLWLQNYGAGTLEKRMEGDVEVEKFVVNSPKLFLEGQNHLTGYFKWRYGQQERLKDLEKLNETL